VPGAAQRRVHSSASGVRDTGSIRCRIPACTAVPWRDRPETVREWSCRNPGITPGWGNFPLNDQRVSLPACGHGRREQGQARCLLTGAGDFRIKTAWSLRMEAWHPGERCFRCVVPASGGAGLVQLVCCFTSPPPVTSGFPAGRHMSCSSGRRGCWSP
jgi:hypothetical protein